MQRKKNPTVTKLFEDALKSAPNTKMCGTCSYCFVQKDKTNALCYLQKPKDGVFTLYQTDVYNFCDRWEKKV